MKNGEKRGKWILLLIGILGAFVLFPNTLTQAKENYASGQTSWYMGSPKNFFTDYVSDKGKAGCILCDSSGHSVDGGFYFCARGKKATTNIRYYTLGYVLTIFSGDGKYEISVEVKRGGKYLQEIGTSYDDGSYIYSLYGIHFDAIAELATAKLGQEKADAFFGSYDQIRLRASAILAVNNNGNLLGVVKEEKEGLLDFEGQVYHMDRLGDRAKIGNIFTATDFSSYYDITATIANHKVTVDYMVGNYSDYPVLTSVGDFTVSNKGFVLKKGKKYEQTLRLFQTGETLPGKTLFSRGGYVFGIDGRNEWYIDGIDSGRKISCGNRVHPSALFPDILRKDGQVTLYCQWEPAFYAVAYHDYDGSQIALQKCRVDDTYFYYTGAQAGTSPQKLFNGWTKEFGQTNIILRGGEEFTNILGAEECLNLYAVGSSFVGTCYVYDGLEGCTPSLNNRFYYVNQVGYFHEKIDTTGMTDDMLKGASGRILSPINVPSKKGFRFLGYQYGQGENAPLLVDEAGRFLDGYQCGLFTENVAAIYGKWEQIPYYISLDANGGTGGSKEAKVYYEEPLPNIVLPSREGWTFLGYNTKKDGAGEWWYSNTGGRLLPVYPKTENTPLYGCWSDRVPPRVEVTTNGGTNDKNWANGVMIAKNNGVTLHFAVYDGASGIQKIKVYRKGVEETTYQELTSYQKSFAYNADLPTKEYSFDIKEKKDGVSLYRIEVVDYGSKTGAKLLPGQDNPTYVEGIAVYVDTVGPYVSDIKHGEGGSRLYATDDNIFR